MNQALLYQLMPLVLLIVAMYFLIMRPQKKKEKEINLMRSNIKTGDEIITIGGICGKVVNVKEETIVIQVGSDKLKFEMMKWSVSKVVSSAEDKKSAKKARPEEAEPKKKTLPKRLNKAEETETAAEETKAAVEEGTVSLEKPEQEDSKNTN